jgi:SAM-dependent methyltransferase
MPVFNAYARYYDLLYRDKDYSGETDYIHNLIRRHAPHAASILNLGCGSGRHDRLLQEKGYTVTGVDLSEEMLASARKHANSTQLSYVQGDIRQVRLGTRFDVVTSLFHVMSYLTLNEDLAAAMETAREHLKPGGVFIFDCWYGPAVLSDRPKVRAKDIEDDTIRLSRIAEPVMHPNENIVDVNYHVFIRDLASGAVEEIRESHRMRYLFMPEISLLAAGAGLEITASEAWLTGEQPDYSTWNVSFACKTSAVKAARLS